MATMNVDIFFYSIKNPDSFTTPVRFVALLSNTEEGQKTWEKGETLGAIRKRLDFFSKPLDWETIERDLSEVGQHRCSASMLSNHFAIHKD